MADESAGIWHSLRSLLTGGRDSSLRGQIKDVIEEHEEEGRGGKGDLSLVERDMLKQVLELGGMRVGDVAVPRADMIAVPEDASFEALVAAFAEAGHSRLPVYRENLDAITGMVHIKDVFAILARKAKPPKTIAKLIRQPRYVPQSMGVLDLLAEMRSTQTHLAIVIDEYSGTDGLVTIEDLVEEIVGEIADEHDDAPVELLVPLADGAWEADARAELDDVAERIDPRLGEVEEDVDTLGGLAFVLAGHVPQPGERLQHASGWTLEITAGDSKRATRLALYPPQSNIPTIDPMEPPA